MKAEKKHDGIKQFSIVMNSNIDEQLEYLAERKQKTKSKIIKELINNEYLNNVTSQR